MTSHTSSDLVGPLPLDYRPSVNNYNVETGKEFWKRLVTNLNVMTFDSRLPELTLVSISILETLDATRSFHEGFQSTRLFRGPLERFYVCD